MKIGVVGLWHLGSVTAASLANVGYDVIGYDPSYETINQLKEHKAPLFEPGLNELLEKNSSRLYFTHHVTDLNEADIIWVTFDTPVDDQDVADVNYVTDQVKKIFSHLKPNSLIIISSQVPVGTTRALQNDCHNQFPNKNICFACSPENLRLGKAIHVFSHPDRVIVGLDDEKEKERIQSLLKPFSDNIIWMSIESAEMTKHALNAFLATSVVFINELASLCERVGADAREVERGLKSEERIGPKAYLRPGNAIAGGTLARDVNYLIQTGQKHQFKTPLFSALLHSNETHKEWSRRRIIDILKNLKNKTITTLGLTYKVGTDTLRRSTALETCEWLSQQGATVLAYDPIILELPQHLKEFIQIKSNLKEAIHNTDAIIISTECPEFLSLDVNILLANAKKPLVFDASGFLAKTLGQDPRVRYFSVGSHA